jgi:2-methylcitrate dehydratase PrpD
VSETTSGTRRGDTAQDAVADLPSGSATATVAEFIVGTSLAGIPDDVRAAAARPILDTVAVLSAGLESEAGQSALAFASATAAGSGDGWVFGSPLAVPAEVAALINGTVGHALDYDDSISLAGGHPSVPVLAALLGLSRSQPLPGRELLEAYIVGYEVTAWLAKALGRAHYRAGWHVTSTAGSFGTTAAVAKLLRFDAAETRTALSAAASMASGLQRNFGTMTKPLHSGLAARNGVLAAQLVRAGLSAAQDVLDGPRGYLGILGIGGEEPETRASLGRRFALTDPGSSLKQFPCCYAAHRAIDGMLKIQADSNFRSGDVEKIICTVPIGGLLPLIHPRPRTGIEAKVSLPYVLAAAFTDRAITPDSFTDDAIRRPEIVSLMGRIETKDEARCRPEDPENKNSGPATGGFVELTVRARGTQAMVRVLDTPGGPDNPASWETLAGKFASCLPGERRARAPEFLPRLRAIESEPDVRALLDELML